MKAANYAENLAAVVLPRVAEAFEMYAERIEPSRPFTISIHAEAKHYEDFMLRIECAARGGYLLSFIAQFPGSRYCASNYVFEAGRTLPEILAWLRGPDCLPEVLKAMAAFDARIGEGLR